MATRNQAGGGSGTGIDFRDRIAQVELPEPVATLADDYDRLFEDRDRFLWQWIYSLFPEFTLSSVPAEHRDHVRTQKTVLTMFVTVLDDLVENHDDSQTFQEARLLTRDPARADPDRAAVDDEQFAFIERLWRTFEDGVADAPRRTAFAEIFEYDMRQTTNAMEYSAVVNRNPHVANSCGARRYGAHNMVMFPYADVDLMYSPSFDEAEFGTLRDLLWDLQEMARIGNWLTTWEREIGEGDFTAGIVVAALEEGIVTPAELDGDEDDVVEKIKAHDIEQEFHDQWETQFESVRNRGFDTTSVDCAALVDGMETVFEYHLASRGYK